jgi:hypothetical protein
VTKVLADLRKFLSYLAGKRSELAELDARDVIMAKVILDIHRKRIGKEIMSVPLFALRQIHVLDRENAIQATKQRIAALEHHRNELVQEGQLTCETLARVLPSVSWIKVVEAPDESPATYLAFEGNGRIAAMQSVFAPEDELLVEVERYTFRNPGKIVRRLNRVRRLNGLIT